ncbi:hypothetical protein L1987_64778 [Smallanthus sonchifolius]|uniref:Uncharacterized protein n=1 Tax=Smallanthus sonchifolius TaxID=185202 RepID=A0ACB9BSP5_9ASTR|nr:hypothetical protein L1987_64778 [Smallanthus sonchifolius]
MNKNTVVLRLCEYRLQMKNSVKKHTYNEVFTRRALSSTIGCTIDVLSALCVSDAFAESCQRRLAWIVSCNDLSSRNIAISSKNENGAADKPISSNLC